MAHFGERRQYRPERSLRRVSNWARAAFLFCGTGLFPLQHLRVVAWTFWYCWCAPFWARMFLLRYVGVVSLLGFFCVGLTPYVLFLVWSGAALVGAWVPSRGPFWGVYSPFWAASTTWWILSRVAFIRPTFCPHTNFGPKNPSPLEFVTPSSPHCPSL